MKPTNKNGFILYYRILFLSVNGVLFSNNRIPVKYSVCFYVWRQINEHLLLLFITVLCGGGRDVVVGVLCGGGRDVVVGMMWGWACCDGGRDVVVGVVW